MVGNMKSVMLRGLLLLLVALGFSVSAQTARKPEAYLFAEAKANNVIEVTKRLRKKLRITARSESPERVYIFVYYLKRHTTALRKTRKLIDDGLYDDCRHCFGYDPPRITFVDIPISTKPKVQIWLVPPGAQAPTP